MTGTHQTQAFAVLSPTFTLPGLTSWEARGKPSSCKVREAGTRDKASSMGKRRCAGVQDSHRWALNKSNLASPPPHNPSMAQISEMSLKIKTKCSVTFSIILKSPLRCGLLLLQRASKQSTGPQSWLGMSGSPCPATSDWPKGSQLCDFVWSFRTGSALHWVSEL